MVDLSVLVSVAADLRLRAEQTEPPFSTTQIVEACFDGAVVVGRTLPPGVDEVATRGPGGVLIVYRRGLSTAEQRFAIAHALAHILFDDDDAACTADATGLPDHEAQADRFAAELLVPLDRLAEFVGRAPSADPAEQENYLDMVDQIASSFHVPATVIHERIQILTRTT